MAQTQTRSLVHAEFDHMCEGVEEFETLPSLPHRGYLGDPAPEPEDPEETELDGQILAGLVLPV